MKGNPHRKYRTPARTGPDTSGWTEEERAAHRRAGLLKTPVAETALSVRVVNTLEENDVILVEHLLAKTYAELMGMKNFGATTLAEVRAAVTALGLAPPAAWAKPAAPPPRPRPPRRTGGGGFPNGVW